MTAPLSRLRAYFTDLLYHEAVCFVTILALWSMEYIVELLYNEPPFIIKIVIYFSHLVIVYHYFTYFLLNNRVGAKKKGRKNKRCT